MTIAIATLSRFLSPIWALSLSTSEFKKPQQPQEVLPRVAPSLRVTRLAESRLPRDVAGRMVISGRIEDVCRELARLEALGQDRPH
jgi:hypothetical protein